ncbi:hypothetical protein [Mycobacterium conspicuum]|jgi:hypothetical protein|uniref:Uncharacterized protein n=1 Tax=Mycobacterium conspicuum TaxID=44010 RepID=A0A1X1TQB7_9MYCO|nr:hypothetical protein [Mycobacterium conspicuum]ORV46767.1 hypothetical protein AWC00_03310 [Mycobacterium conspicuum]BBZ40335.1 hypothetical protein MCNS_33980 [Mycobacterium conspicuum]
MDVQHRDTTGPTSDTGIQPPPGNEPAHRRPRVWVNWALALLTVPAAALVMIFDLGAAMSTASCSGARCPALGPHGLVYGVLLYGAPVIAALTIVASLFTATRRRGFFVPLWGLALLLGDVALTSMLFSK